MLGHALAHREHPSLGIGVLQGRDVLRRRRRRRADDVLQDPLAAKHGRCPVGVRRDRQHAALSQNAPARTVLVERDAPEAAAVHVRDPVVFGEPLVHERVVGAEQIERAPVLLHDALDEQLGFAPECLTQVVVEVGERPGVRTRGSQVPQIEPLAREVGDERFGLGTREHPLHLPLQRRRPAERARRRQVQQFIVGDAAPQEEREPRGQFDVAHAVRRSRPLRLLGSRSIRNRNSVLASTARSAISIPSSKSPSARASL